MALAQSLREFILRLARCLALVAPAAYVAYISAVAIHELAGHGLGAELLGGQFYGFALMPDGMGWAAVESQRNEKWILAAGAIAGVMFGVVFAVLAMRASHPFLRLILCLFATCTFLDALPYVFWNSLYPHPPGDFGRILQGMEHGALRWSLVITSGAAYLAATYGCTRAVCISLEAIVGPLTRRQTLFVRLVVLGIGGALLWFTFDWNQLIEGVGRVPQFIGAGLQLSVALLLIRLPSVVPFQEVVSSRLWLASIVGAWLAALSLFGLTELKLKHGVYWD